jgi:hypothetical protein
MRLHLIMLKSSDADIAQPVPSGANAIADFLNSLIAKLLSQRRRIG